MSDNEKVPVEEAEDTDLIVVDPDDYYKTQKLKAIKDAKQHYREFVTKQNQKARELRDTWKNPQEAFEHQKAEALALYASELLPLIEEGIEKGALSEEDLILETDEMAAALLDKPEMNIKEIANTQGRIWANNEKQAIPESYQMRVYRQLERIERELGFGLELEEDKGPAQI